MATSTDSVKSSPLASQYEELNNNFNQVNGWLKEVLREGGSKHQIKSCLLSLEQLSKEMKEVVEKMNSEDPIEASRYSLMQNDARIEMQKRIAESISQLSAVERLPVGVKSLVFSGLSCSDLALASGAVSDWRVPCQTMLESAIQHEIQKPCLTQDELVEKIYFLTKCNHITDAVVVLRRKISYFNINRYEETTQILRAVVGKLVKSGKTELALQLIREFRYPVGNVDGPLLLTYAADQALNHALEVLLELDDVERALAIARGLEQPDRSNYLQRISMQRLQVGDIEPAIEAMRELEPNKRPYHAYAIMTSLKEKGRNAEAIALLPEIPCDHGYFSAALIEVVIPILLQEGDFERAIGMALCITDQHLSLCLGTILRYLVEHGEIDRAYDLVKHMSAMVENLQWPTYEMRALATAFARRGSLDRAIEIRNHANEADRYEIGEEIVNAATIRLEELKASSLQHN